ncbi:UDP-glucose 4-epimerase [Actinomadura cremea]|nr:UDP-glucose 4-epimerase [Actinomadura cremea]
MERALVTGGSGFIGAHLVDRLVARGDEVTVFDAVPSRDGRGSPRDHARHVTGDVRAADALAEVIKPGVDVVYHLAAIVGVDRYLTRPLDVIDINVLGTRNVLELAARAGARVLVASTSEVFGKNPAVPWGEDGDRVLGPTTADRWTYSSSKALAEHMTFAFGRQHGLESRVVRFFNVYGPRQRPAYIVSRSVHRALNGIPPVVYDRGGQTRCFTYVDDAVEGALLAAGNPAAAGYAFNIGTTDETTVAEVVALVNKLAGVEATPLQVDTAEKLGPVYEDLPRRVPDTVRAAGLLGWRPRTGLEDGLTRTIDWARENPWWLSLPDQGAG